MVIHFGSAELSLMICWLFLQLHEGALRRSCGAWGVVGYNKKGDVAAAWFNNLTPLSHWEVSLESGC